MAVFGGFVIDIRVILHRDDLVPDRGVLLTAIPYVPVTWWPPKRIRPEGTGDPWQITT
ncbi:hypothetical protein Slala02_47620 [Streptomyces lavendulae subsp. lavendulae]|nr:hypothetical protein Slala01_51690 [Streptomyces lavendulae subsp. lavendulae]GLX28942.1 hypothetical protein Slala02_47620 [Streptomyces lavendulae subsp. lavendulae]